MKLAKLSFEREITLQDFVDFWSAFYDYPKEHLYAERIDKTEFTVDDIHKLYEWKNGTPLSQQKIESLRKITNKIHIVNNLKRDFDLEFFKQEFKAISAIWKIYLLHLIVPNAYPIFDQHVCRAFYFITGNDLKEIPTTNKDKEKLYFGGYVSFFDGLADENVTRKKIDEALWAFGKFLKTIYGQKIIFPSPKIQDSNLKTKRTIPVPKILSFHSKEKGEKQMANGDIIMGPYAIDRIVLCSADASPRSQSSLACGAAYFFPGARWVGAVRNAADRLHCGFAILTTAHGLVDPNTVITPYDMHIVGNEEQIEEIWGMTIQALIGNGQYDIIIFYAGGCPRDKIIDIILPILQRNNIDLLSFGKPNMCDIDKIDFIVNQLTEGTTIDTLRGILRLPDRLLFFPHN